VRARPFRAGSFRRLVGALIDPRKLTPQEILAAAAVLLVPAVAIFGARIVHGGFAYDDWAISADIHRYGVLGTIRVLFLFEHTRPLQGPYAAIYAVVGSHQRALLVWAAGLHVAVSWVLYVLLRTLGLERLGAIAIATLALLIPASDALWLWGNAAVVSVAILLYLLGSVAVLNAFASSDRRRARALHVIGLVLYLMSVLLYELAAIAILASIGLYLVRAPRRAALRRWLLDVTCISLVLLFVTSGKVHWLPGSEAHASSPVSQWPSHLGMIIDQGARVLASAAVPFGSPSTAAVCAAGVVLAIAGASVSRLSRYGSAPRRWVAIGIAGTVLALAGWAPLIPAVSYYSPGVLGVGTRINALATVGLSVTLFAAAMVAGLLLFGTRSRAWPAGAATILTAVVLTGYVRRDDADRAAWNAATLLSQRELGEIRTLLVKPPRHRSTIYLFGAPPYTALGVPVFAAPWDLNGAVQLTWHDISLRAVPVLPGIRIACGKTTLYPTGGGLGLAQLTPYGRAIFVNIPGAGAQSTAVTISSRSQCSSVTRRLVPG
jgi:hypothetical protein